MEIYNKLKNEGIIYLKNNLSNKILKENTGSHKRLEQKVSDLNKKNLKEFILLREEMELSEWIDFLLISIGYNTKELLAEEKIIIILRLLPFVEKNYHILEVSKKGLGKSYTYSSLSDKSKVVTGSLSLPSLSVKKSGKDPELGVINIYNDGVVAFDEITEIDNISKDIMSYLRTYMTSGESGREEAKYFSNASLVFLGNIADRHIEALKNEKKIEGSFYDSLPEEILKKPFLDRIALSIPSWNLRKTSKKLYEVNGEGLVADYLIHQLINLREKESKKISFDNKVYNSLDLRESNSITSTVRGLLKLFYPNENYKLKDKNAMLNIALYGKEILKNEFITLEKANKGLNLDCYRNFLFELSKDKLRKYNKIEKLYYHKGRIIVKPLKEDKLYKVAINEVGLKNNEKELKLSKNRDLETYILKVEKENQFIVSQDYRKPESEFNIIKFSSNEKTNIDIIKDENIKNILNERDIEISNLKKDISNLKKNIKEYEEKMESNFRKFQDYLRLLKIDLLNVELSGDDTVVNLKRIDHSGFLNFNHKFNIEDYFDEVKNLIKIDEIKESDYTSLEDGSLLLLNYCS